MKNCEGIRQGYFATLVLRARLLEVVNSIDMVTYLLS